MTPRHDRTALGAADVDDDAFAAMVAALVGAEPSSVRVLDSRADVFPYDLPAITTAGRYLVSGTAEVDGERTAYEMFVKVVQSWSRHELFQFVPDEMKTMAEAMVPWRTEPLAYRSDLGSRLPHGLTMPRAVGVFDLDEKSAAVWLEKVPVLLCDWTGARYDRAAYLLGRLSGSASVAELADVGKYAFTLRDYANGRLMGDVFPTLFSEEVWLHPLIAGAFGDELRDRMRAAASEVMGYVEEAMTLPYLAAHNDACPNNLLTTSEDGFTLIDYGFWGPMPAGADLSQLLIGDVQIGKRRAGDLAARDDAHIAQYVRGLRDEGCQVSEADVRRGHALHMLIMSGLSTVPTELLERPPSPAFVAMAADRAAIAAFCLDRLTR